MKHSTNSKKCIFAQTILRDYDAVTNEYKYVHLFYIYKNHVPRSLYAFVNVLAESNMQQR